MTDEPAYRPRTATVALLAPAVAVVLAGSLAWAAGHPPTPQPTKSATAAAQLPGGDIERLRQELNSLRAELRALGSTGTDRRNGSPNNGALAPATSKPKPARTGPPPVHATTGAS